MTKDNLPQNDDIKYTKLTNGHFSAVMSKSNSLSNHKNLNLDALDGTKLILMDSNWCPPKQFELQRRIKKYNSNLDLSYVTDVSTAYLMCRSNLRISIMPEFIAGHNSVVPLNYDTDLCYGIGRIKSENSQQIINLIELIKRCF